MTQYITFGMTIRKEFGDVLFSLPFRWSVSDERSFAYAQDDKGKEFGMTFFVFVIPIMLFLFLSFRGTIVTRNLILNKQ